MSETPRTTNTAIGPAVEVVSDEVGHAVGGGLGAGIVAGCILAETLPGHWISAAYLLGSALAFASVWLEGRRRVQVAAEQMRERIRRGEDK